MAAPEDNVLSPDHLTREKAHKKERKHKHKHKKEKKHKRHRERERSPQAEVYFDSSSRSDPLHKLPPSESSLILNGIFRYDERDGHSAQSKSPMVGEGQCWTFTLTGPSDCNFIRCTQAQSPSSMNRSAFDMQEATGHSGENNHEQRSLIPTDPTESLATLKRKAGESPSESGEIDVPVQPGNDAESKGHNGHLQAGEKHRLER